MSWSIFQLFRKYINGIFIYEIFENRDYKIKDSEIIPLFRIFIPNFLSPVPAYCLTFASIAKKRLRLRIITLIALIFNLYIQNIVIPIKNQSVFDFRRTLYKHFKPSLSINWIEIIINRYNFVNKFW